MRTTPYRDVTRAKCERCGAPGKHQWSGVCAERKGKVIYHVLCGICDRGLNYVTLKFMYGAREAKALIKEYRG